MTDAQILEALMRMSWKGGLDKWLSLRKAIESTDPFHHLVVTFKSYGIDHEYSLGGPVTTIDLATILFDHSFIRGLVVADTMTHRDYIEHNFRKYIMDLAIKPESERLQHLKNIFLESTP